MLNIAPGTIVTRQKRGLRQVTGFARVVDAFTRQDALGRTTHHYRVQLLEIAPNGNALHRNWPASHVVPVGPPPTTEAFADLDHA